MFTGSRRGFRLGVVLAAVFFIPTLVILTSCGSDPTGGLTAKSPEATNELFNGVPDKQNHPYVGTAIYTSLNAPGWHQGCTLTLVAPKIAVGVAHCWWGVDPNNLPEGLIMAITFDPVAIRNPDAAGFGELVARHLIPYPSYTWVIDPLFDMNNWPSDEVFGHDVALVYFKENVWLDEYAVLPPKGLVEALFTAGYLDGKQFEYVGYGANIDPTDYLAIGNLFGTGTRRRGLADFNDLWAGTLFTLADLTKGEVFCEGGDSGAPALFPSTNLMAGLISSAYYDTTWDVLFNLGARLDGDMAQGFLSQHVPIPNTIEMCHNGRQSISVPVSGVVAHANHGDTIGKCSSCDGK
ncbi:MAG TPA: hypothetical protein VMT17_03045 [Anaeromyxobacteraceae bacterium]|nr:hypothetical protein [Anaeromyxobacteraceae bacterium]